MFVVIANVGVPLNGPGFDGGTSATYLSTNYAGFTVEQGTYENKRDSSINVKDYSKSNITPITIFSFSGMEQTLKMFQSVQNQNLFHKLVV